MDVYVYCYEQASRTLNTPKPLQELATFNLVSNQVYLLLGVYLAGEYVALSILNNLCSPSQST